MAFKVQVGPPQIAITLIQSLAQGAQQRGAAGALGKNPTFVLPQDLDGEDG